MHICPGCDLAWCLGCKPDWQACVPAAPIVVALGGGRGRGRHKAENPGRGRGASSGRGQAAAKKEGTVKKERTVVTESTHPAAETSDTAGDNGGSTPGAEGAAGTAPVADEAMLEVATQDPAAAGTAEPGDIGASRQTHLGEWWAACPAPPAPPEEELAPALKEQVMWEQVAERPAMPTATWAPRSVAA